ncbi:MULTISPECIES: DUF1433 domain-containing protein [Virgibacillus]|uniref:DUF1433 domain-containing protein n=1 Tax=Virgibacillus TaxID=84406 RepID=UPI0013CEC706|nr:MULTISPECIES: DUF1433 domain-containing protein [Virgibacillus]
MNSNEEDFNNETIRKAKETAESYLKNNFNNIEQIEFSDDYKSGMGGIMIRGIVNNNKEANFSIDIDVYDNGVLEVGSIGKGKEFPKRKDECREKTCDY